MTIQPRGPAELPPTPYGSSARKLADEPPSAPMGIQSIKDMAAVIDGLTFAMRREFLKLAVAVGVADGEYHARQCEGDPTKIQEAEAAQAIAAERLDEFRREMGIYGVSALVMEFERNPEDTIDRLTPLVMAIVGPEIDALRAEVKKLRRFLRLLTRDVRALVDHAS